MASSTGSNGGTIRSIPLRVDYINGDWEKARLALDEKQIAVMYQSVSSVAPYTATLHVSPDDAELAKSTLQDAGIACNKPVPYY